MHVIDRDTIGEAWQASIELIRREGHSIRDDGDELTELMHLLLTIASPRGDDPVAEAHLPAERAWMRENFTRVRRVPELADAWSYAWRLYEYDGVNQVDWIVAKLRAKPQAKSATISMLRVAGIESYVPCVSLLDFKIRDETLTLTALCRSLDFGRKAIHNMTNLAALLQAVASRLEVADTRLVLHVISAHVYEKSEPSEGHGSGTGGEAVNRSDPGADREHDPLE